jgi:hypothetical protein
MVKPVNLSENDIADLQKTQWLHCRAGTAGRASAEQVAGFKSHDLRKFGDMAPYAEDQMARF